MHANIGYGRFPAERASFQRPKWGREAVTRIKIATSKFEPLADILDASVHGSQTSDLVLNALSKIPRLHLDRIKMLIRINGVPIPRTFRKPRGSSNRRPMMKLIPSSMRQLLRDAARAGKAATYRRRDCPIFRNQRRRGQALGGPPLRTIVVNTQKGVLSRTEMPSTSCSVGSKECLAIYCQSRLATGPCGRSPRLAATI